MYTGYTYTTPVYTGTYHIHTGVPLDSYGKSNYLYCQITTCTCSNNYLSFRSIPVHVQDWFFLTDDYKTIRSSGVSLSITLDKYCWTQVCCDMKKAENTHTYV